MNGGPAFPGSITVGPTDDLYSGTEGMSLRDYFAAAALPTLIEFKPGGSALVIAELAYDYANAMLEARKEEKRTDEETI